jgi:predicted thioesterase
VSEIKPGLHGEYTTTVTEDKTAKHLGSGGVEVFATPAMIATMEKASLSAIDPLLDEGYMSVGIEVSVRHLRATPVGQEVRARSEVTAVEGSRVTFKVEAWDETEKIGEGTHQRAIVELARFKEGLRK